MKILEHSIDFNENFLNKSCKHLALDNKLLILRLLKLKFYIEVLLFEKEEEKY